MHNLLSLNIKTDQGNLCEMFPESMCPTRLAKEGSLEASGDAKDWGVCSKKCPLKYYRTNQQLYDQVAFGRYYLLLTPGCLSV